MTTWDDWDKWENGTLEEKRTILNAIGVKIVLRNKTLDIYPRSMMSKLQEHNALPSSGSIIESSVRLVDAVRTLIPGLPFEELAIYRQLIYWLGVSLFDKQYDRFSFLLPSYLIRSYGQLLELSDLEHLSPQSKALLPG